MKNLFSYLLFFAGVAILPAPPITPPTIQGFMQGGSTWWIFYLTIMSAVLYSNMLLYKFKKVRAEQKVAARMNAKFAFALYIAYILGNLATGIFPLALNYIAGFTFLWSALEAYRFNRTTMKLVYFERLRACNDKLHLLFINYSFLTILDREFTLESLRLVLRNHSEYSEKVLSEVERKLFGKWVDSEVKKAMQNLN